MSMTNKEIDSIIEKIRNARKRCQEITDDNTITDGQLKDTAEFGDDVICELIKSMCDYTVAVFDDKSNKLNRTSLMESNQREDYIDIFEAAEKRRKSEHNDLITSIKVADLVCRQIGVPEIYGKLPDKYKNDVSEVLKAENRDKPGVLEVRHGIANWTFDFILGCAIAQNMEIDSDISHSKDSYQNDRETFENAQKDLNVSATRKMIEDITEPER